MGYWESLGWSNNAEIAPVNDWRVHALLFSGVFLLGGFAAISGARLYPSGEHFRNLPQFVNRKFHVATSLIFFPSAAVTFVYWSISTFLARSAIFYTLHGLLGLITVAIILTGGIEGVHRLRRGARRPWHWKLNLCGYIFLLFTILLGFALSASSDILSRIVGT